MRGREFLHLAKTLAANSTEAEWRSAVSRAYYGVFHATRELLEGFGFTVPRSEKAHAYIWLRLSNAAQPIVRAAGADLQVLRRDRNQADYDLGRAFSRKIAEAKVKSAEALLQTLEALASDPLRTQIIESIRLYERNTLKDVTWHP